MSTLTGKIKWYNGKKGYGFIERDDKEKDAFVHASAVKTAGMRYLNEGDKLGPSVITLANYEGLVGHAQSVIKRIRRK